MTDDIIGSITGTATFESVDIDCEPDGYYHVQGYYQGSCTTYQVPTGFLYIGGISVDPNSESKIALRPEGEKDFLWVEATEDNLYITKTKREE